MKITTHDTRKSQKRKLLLDDYPPFPTQTISQGFNRGLSKE